MRHTFYNEYQLSYAITEQRHSEVYTFHTGDFVRKICDVKLFLQKNETTEHYFKNGAGKRRSMKEVALKQ